MTYWNTALKNKMNVDEAMLATGHDGQISMVPLGKCRYRFNGCQVVMLTVENTGRDIPDNRVLAHIAKILP